MEDRDKTGDSAIQTKGGNRFHHGHNGQGVGVSTIVGWVQITHNEYLGKKVDDFRDKAAAYEQAGTSNLFFGGAVPLLFQPCLFGCLGIGVIFD